MRHPLGAALPLVGSRGWHAARLTLYAALLELGGKGAWRSPGALWGALKGGRPPAGATWADLVVGHSLAEVLAAEKRKRGTTVRVATWNVRWLRDPHTAAATAKRAVILRLLAEGCIVLLQETHSGPQAHAAWRNSFPTTEVLASYTREGPQGDPCGGVAVLVPARFQVMEVARSAGDAASRLSCRSGGAGRSPSRFTAFTSRRGAGGASWGSWRRGRAAAPGARWRRRREAT